jgi:V8-like Glu-specific endopeptidase
VVLTAAHCLAYYEPGKSGKTPVAAKDIHLLGSDLWPGCTASGAIVSETWTPPRWGHPNRLVSVENDYGLMRLSCNPGNTVGWLGYGFTGRKPKAMSRSGQIGYFRKSAPLSQSQTAATSAPLDVLKRVRGFFSYDANLPALAFYNHTTEPGVSGSPVFSQGKWTECANCVVAVHGHSARDIDETIPDSKQFLKLGVMITGQVFKDIRQFVEKKK